VTLTKAVVLAQPPTAASALHRDRVGLPPAPLLSVANRSLLEHALGWLAKAGVRDTAVIVPQELAGQTRAAARAPAGLELNWLEQLPGETVGDALGELTGFLGGEPFVLHLADSLARQGLRSLTSRAPGNELAALLVLDESRSANGADVIDLHPGPAHPAIRSAHRGGAGVALIGGRAIEAIGALDAPPDQLLERLMARIEDNGGLVRTRCVRDWWRFRGGPEALLEGNRFALEGLRADYNEGQLVDSTIQGAVVVHPDALIESSVVRGPAIIGARTRLREAYVGPYTSIGDDVLIEGAEVEHSVVFPGASVRHLSGRLEASVIGPGARIFRDFRLPRAFRMTVGEGAEVSLT
jgi:glucose-1-phosphate thymidylyltransferase